MWEKENELNDVKNALNASGLPMPCGCLFDMIYDILFDMTLFEMIVISISKKFGTTINLK